MCTALWSLVELFKYVSWAQRQMRSSLSLCNCVHSDIILSDKTVENLVIFSRGNTGNCKSIISYNWRAQNNIVCEWLINPNGHIAEKLGTVLYQTILEIFYLMYSNYFINSYNCTILIIMISKVILKCLLIATTNQVVSLHVFYPLPLCLSLDLLCVSMILSCVFSLLTFAASVYVTSLDHEIWRKYLRVNCICTVAVEWGKYNVLEGK